MALVFFLTKKWKNLIYTVFSGIGVVVTYAPWIFVFVSQLKKVQNSYWIEAVSLKGVILQLLYMFRTKPATLLLLGVTGLGFLYAIITFLKGHREPILGIGVWIGTIIIGNLLSLLIRPIFVSRYQIPSAGCLWLALAIALSGIDNKKLKKWASFILVSACFIVNLCYVRSDYKTNRNTQIAIGTLNQYIKSDTVIMSDYNHIQSVVAIQYPENENVVVDDELAQLTESVYSDCYLTRCDGADVDQYKGKKMLVLEQNGELHNLLEQNDIETTYLGKCSVDRYTFDLYVTPLSE